MEHKKMDVRVVKYLVLAAALVLGILYFEPILSFAGRLWGIASPLVIGGVIAYILNIIMKALERMILPKTQKSDLIKLRRMICIILSLILIAAMLSLILWLVIPELINAFGVIGQSIPVMFEKLQTWAAENEELVPAVAAAITELEIDWQSLGNNLLEYLRSGLGGFLGTTFSIVGAVAGGVMNFVIGLIFAIYILASKEKLAAQLKKVIHAYAKPDWIRKGKVVLTTVNATFSSFIVGQFTEAIVLGSLCTIGMLILRFPYAPMIGAFIGATALIPVVGAYLGAFVGAFMILTVDPIKAVFFLIFIVVLQQLEGNLIYPRVVGSSIGLPGMWVLAAVTVGGGLMGVGGMLLGVPTVATLYKLLARDVNEKNGLYERKEKPQKGNKNQDKKQEKIQKKEQPKTENKLKGQPQPKAENQQKGQSQPKGQNLSDAQSLENPTQQSLGEKSESKQPSGGGKKKKKRKKGSMQNTTKLIEEVDRLLEQETPQPNVDEMMQEIMNTRPSRQRRNKADRKQGEDILAKYAKEDKKEENISENK